MVNLFVYKHTFISMFDIKKQKILIQSIEFVLNVYKPFFCVKLRCNALRRPEMSIGILAVVNVKELTFNTQFYVELECTLY